MTAAETRRDPASYTDPNGYVFWQGDAVRRRIIPARAGFMRALLANPGVVAMVADGTLVGTAVAHDADDDLVLAHDTIWPLSYPAEWPPGMLRAAARHVVTVAARAAEAGYMLADGHPWNVLFNGPVPVFIDIGSLTEPTGNLLWPAQAQFDRLARYPLHLWAAGLGDVARARLADLALGASANLLMTALPTTYRLSRPGFSLKLLAHRAAELATDGPRAKSGAVRPVDPVVLAKLRPGYFRGLQRELDALRFPGDSAWAAYYADCPSMGASEEVEKQRLLERLFAERKPARVLDLGANTGLYAKLAAKAGAQVVAVDQDPVSMDRLWHEVSQAKLNILPLVMDLGCPTPASGWCAEQRPDALTRLQGDMALMLALIHHLVFTGNASLEQVAHLAARATRRLTVLEWVGPDDGMSIQLRRTATKDFSFYTLEAMQQALIAEGLTVESLPPHAPHRQLLLCNKA